MCRRLLCRSTEPSVFDTIHERNACVQSENEMERKFAEYFADFTSEWIPCNDDDGSLMVFLGQEVGMRDSNAWLKTFSWAASSIFRMTPGELRGLDRQAFDNGVDRWSGLVERLQHTYYFSSPSQLMSCVKAVTYQGFRRCDAACMHIHGALSWSCGGCCVS